jgi:Protein of unknown function (DUF2723)
LKLLKKYYAILTGIIVLIVYLTTLAPSVVEIDAGELATVQVMLGIAHPTGYPLFTLLGHLFSLIPFHFSKIYQLNLLTAIWCSLAVTVFVYTCKFILDNLIVFEFNNKVKLQKESKKGKRKKREEKEEQFKSISKEKLEEPIKYIASISAGLLLGFDRTFWNQGNAVEVYSLQAFLFCLIIFSLLKAYITPEGERGLTIRWLIFAAILALGFSNHMTTLFVLPTTAYLYFDKFKLKIAGIKRLSIMIFLIFLPIFAGIYLYLPIRASQNPVLNWGNPVDFERFLRHVSGWQFQVWFFKSPDVMKKQLDYFFSNLFSEFSIGILLCLYGIFISYLKARKFFIFNIILLLFSLLYASNYDIVDIDSYFLLSYVALSFFALFGMVQIFSKLRFKKYNQPIVTALIALCILIQLILNYKENDLKDVHTFEDYSKSTLNSTTPNAIILTYLWDYLVSPSYYFQLVEKYRPDVVVVDKELLRRSWYYGQINRLHPGLLDGVNTEVNMFEDALKPFERNKTFDSNLLENLYRKIMTNLVSTNVDKRDIYIGSELVENEMQKGEFVLPQGYTVVPDNLLFRIVKGKEYVPVSDPIFTIRLPRTRTKYIDFMENAVGTMLARRALYEIQFNKIERAKIYIQKIKKEFPNYIIPPELLQATEK